MTASSNFHDTDPSGLQTLERFARAGRFNRWLFETIYPYCSGKVLEVGSGIGNLSRFFLEKKFLLTASDLRDEYCNILHEKFGRNPYLEAIQPIDLTLPGFEMHYHSMTGKFNTIVALNVIEHIKDAGLAINNCKKLLMPGGCMVILVPAYPFLYNELDKELGHFIRYTSGTLQQLLQQEKLEIIHKEYFNAAGIPGWFLNGTLFRKRIVPRAQLQLFDKLVPVMKLADTITFHRIGLSVIAVARKSR